MKRPIALLLVGLSLLTFACSSGSSSSSGSTGSSGDDTSSGGSSSGQTSGGGSDENTKRPSNNGTGSTTSTSGSSTKTEKYSCSINGECFKCATAEQFKTCLGPNNQCTPVASDYCEQQ